MNGFAEGCGDVKTGGIGRKIVWGMLLILALLISVWAESPVEKEEQPKGYIALTMGRPGP